MVRAARAGLVVFVFLGGAAASAGAEPPPADLTAQVDAIFSKWTADTPGCAVAVGHDARDLVQRAYGSADLEHGIANTPDTVFEAGSVSKQFTAAAILLLVQAGRLKLDDPVQKYVPELPDYGETLTLRHLLHHTSGLRDWGTVVEAAGWPRGSRVHTHAHVLDVVSRQKSLNFPPGAEYLYSNTGYNLLAIIVERVSGKTFARYTRDMVFEPLGMTHTQWRDDFTRVVKGRGVAYARQPDGYHLSMPFENVHGNGGLLTTVGDLMRWQRNFTSLRVGGRALVAELQRRGRLRDGLEISYARGLVIGTFRGVPEVSHSGSTAGYRAFLARYPDQGLSVAVLCNAADADAPALGRRLAVAALGDALGPPSTVTAVPMDAAALAARAGLYRSLRTGEPVRVTAQEGKLRLASGVELVPLSDSLFATGDGSVRVEFGGTGAARTAEVIRPDGDTERYALAGDWTPSAADLARYEGAYVSEEAEVTYVVRVEGETLLALRRPDTRIALAPAYRDAFTAPGIPLVLFRRDAKGQVTGLSLGLGRVRDLRFRRLSAPAESPADR